MIDGTITFRLAQFIDWVSEEAGGCIRAKKRWRRTVQMQDMEIIRSRGANGFETDADMLKK